MLVAVRGEGRATLPVANSAEPGTPTTLTGMSHRVTRIVSAAVVLLIGLVALKRVASDSDVPVAPGTWNPVD